MCGQYECMSIQNPGPSLQDPGSRVPGSWDPGLQDSGPGSTIPEFKTQDARILGYTIPGFNSAPRIHIPGLQDSCRELSWLLLQHLIFNSLMIIRFAFPASLFCFLGHFPIVVFHTNLLHSEVMSNVFVRQRWRSGRADVARPS